MSVDESCKGISHIVVGETIEEVEEVGIVRLRICCSESQAFDNVRDQAGGNKLLGVSEVVVR